MRYLLRSLRPLIEDLAGTLVFYVLFLATSNAKLSAAVGLAIGLGQIAAHRRRGGRIPRLLALGVLLTLILGGATIATDDPGFMLIKPTIIYCVVGVSMLSRGWMARYVPEATAEAVPAARIDRFGKAWAALMFATAAANAVLVALLPAKTAAAIFIVAATASKVALFWFQSATLRAAAQAPGRTRR